MSEDAPPPSTTRRRLLGATGGVVAGVGALNGIRNRTARAAGTQESTPTRTATPAPEAVWPAFQVDARNSGHAPDGDGPASGVGARWGHLDGGAYTTTPVVTETTVLAADGGDDAFRAIDRVQGTERWRRELDLSAGRPVVRGDAVYVPTSQSGAQLQVLDVGDGTTRWSLNLERSPSGIAVAGNSLYAATTGGVVRVSLLSQGVDWQNDGVTLADTSVAVGNDAVYAADTTNGKTVKIDPSTGSSSWTSFPGAAARGAPTVAGERVIVPLEGAVVAFGDGAGREQGRYEADVRSSVAVADGVVYATTAGGEAVALDAATGQERWRTAAVAGSNSPVVVGDRLYLAGTDGSLAALDPGVGSTAWSAGIGAAVAANPAVVGGELYLGDRQGRLAALAPGASGGYGDTTPTPTDTPTPTPSPTGTATPSPTGTSTPGSGGTPSPTPTPIDLDDDSGGDGAGDGGDGGDTPRPDTPSSGGGGLGLGLIGAGVAALVALLGGGLWWRRNQGNEYDPLG